MENNKLTLLGHSDYGQYWEHNYGHYQVILIDCIRVETQTEHNYAMWTSKYLCANFKGVDIKQMPLFDEMFNVNVNVYSLQPDNSATMLDQVQTVLSKLYSNENTYIQNISMIRMENSNITIYHQHQKLLMNSLIEDCDFVFNLSSVYVTVTVFKHNMLRGKSPNTPPLLIGPVYYHWNAKLETYKDFLHHVETYFLTDEKC